MSISPSDEGFWARTGRKNRENPFIFPAVAATIFGLWRMSKAMYKSDAIGFQMAQRWRVGAQVAALAAFGGGVMFQEWNKHQKLVEARNLEMAGTTTPPAPAPSPSPPPPPPTSSSSSSSSSDTKTSTKS